MSVSFNFKREKKVKEVEEKYSFPVLTQLPKQEEKKSVAKFKMNKALMDILQVNGKDCSISIGQSNSGEIVLVNTTTIDTPHQSHVNADGTINNRFLLDRVVRMFEIDPNEEHEFSLEYLYEEDFHMAVIKDFVKQEVEQETEQMEEEEIADEESEDINEESEEEEFSGLLLNEDNEQEDPQEEAQEEQIFDQASIPDEMSEINRDGMGLPNSEPEAQF